MVGDKTQPDTTRRDTLKYGGTLLAGGALAGCVSDADGGESDGQGSYEACIEPAGCLTFEEVPETYIVNNGEWADMAFALGQRDGFQTATTMIPGFLFEPFGLDVPPESETTSLSTTNWDKEIFYDHDPDVILMDRNYMHETGWDDSWDEEDTEEIEDNVAPFFGNNILRRRDFHDYKLYTLYEAFDRLADLFQERDRYEAFTAVHDELQETVQSRLPPESERPEVAVINSASDPTNGTFYTVDTESEGVETKHFRDLGIDSAYPDDLVEQGTIDYEQLLDVDPEVIMVHWGIGTTGDQTSFSPEAFHDQYVKPMADDGAGSQLTAVKNGNVYPGAFGSQGPLVNLLQTELTAQQLFPDEFGEFDPASFPEVPEEHQLFDRQRVADIVNGDI